VVVESNTPSDEPQLSAIETVRCLSCGSAYAKPAGGGTVRANPGCPDCGYVGWVLDGSVFRRGAAPRRSAVDRLRRRTG
jgi:transposase-like protein